MTEKTRHFEIAEAYAEGYKAAMAEMPEITANIKAWKESPEAELVIAIRTYAAKIAEEIVRGQK